MRPVAAAAIPSRLAEADAPSPSSAPCTRPQTQDFKDEAQKQNTHKKNDSFAAAYGTVLFFEDTGASRRPAHSAALPSPSRLAAPDSCRRSPSTRPPLPSLVARSPPVLATPSAPIEGSQKNVPLFAHHFPQWSEHATGIAQAYTWVALSEAKVGASLQHYGNLIADDVLALWDLPKSWVIKAQMPFGGVGGAPKPKSFQPIKERVKTFGAASE